MTAPQLITIEGRLPGLNEYTRACRAGYHAGNRMKRECTNRVAWVISEAKLEPYDVPIEVGISWLEPNLKRDIDNVTFAAKFILDALKECQVIKDDSIRYVRRIINNIGLDRERPRIVVALMAYEPNRTVTFKEI